MGTSASIRHIEFISSYTVFLQSQLLWFVLDVKWAAFSAELYTFSAMYRSRNGAVSHINIENKIPYSLCPFKKHLEEYLLRTLISVLTCHYQPQGLELLEDVFKQHLKDQRFCISVNSTVIYKPYESHAASKQFTYVFICFLYF